VLDEPTNHLDIDRHPAARERAAEEPAAIVVTHDRAFLDRVTTPSSSLTRTPRSYAALLAYERSKAGRRRRKTSPTPAFDKFWAQEEVWIRKARSAAHPPEDACQLERLAGERAARASASRTLTSRRRGRPFRQAVAELSDVGKALAS